MTYFFSRYWVIYLYIVILSFAKRFLVGLRLVLSFGRLAPSSGTVMQGMSVGYTKSSFGSIEALQS